MDPHPQVVGGAPVHLGALSAQMHEAQAELRALMTRVWSAPVPPVHTGGPGSHFPSLSLGFLICKQERFPCSWADGMQMKKGKCEPFSIIPGPGGLSQHQLLMRGY